MIMPIPVTMFMTVVYRVSNSIIVDQGHELSWDRMLMRNQDSNGNVIIVCNNDK